MNILVAAGEPTAGDARLIVSIAASIVVVVALIVWAKLHPFFSLFIGSVVMALAGGIPIEKSVDSFTDGLGSTIGSTGVLIAFGATTGGFLMASGAAQRIVDTLLDKTSDRMLPWTVALIAALVGIPLFFEVGVVLLIPIVLMIAAKTRKPVMLLAIPALAGLSTLHGFVPPHPGPLAAIDQLHANLGDTLALGLLVAIPVLIISGPLLALVIVRMVPKVADLSILPDDAGGGSGSGPVGETPSRRPSFALAMLVVLLPVVLMLGHAMVEAFVGEETQKSLGFRILAFLGSPTVALGITAMIAILFLGPYVGNRTAASKTVERALASVASIVFIVGAGGGFKQTIVDTGIASLIGRHAAEAAISPLVLAWLIAVFIRLATGSATVATVTASGIAAQFATGLSPTHVALMVLAIGAGSVFLSHVNDAGFWLVKEYFSLTIGETFKSWSLMECVVSVVGLGVVLLLSLVV
ncbi:gluconate:H+ symporter [Tsukamurella sp. 8F]|uniref:GntP family permease n=1 Tax=Tsukamurella sp. 8F TaxID=3031961 RepID=UPI0023B9F5CA|nr:gluconate:H+ symporter [Tsukamurella sp. 8F]MDF0586123.1 gluconate:H+ symporter [Tsukamurella sp. 8F]